jgi:hypothetical protein
VAHALFDVCCQSIVGIDSGSLIVDGLCRVADVGNTVIDVAALVVFVVEISIGQADWAAGIGSLAPCGSLNVVTVRIDLAVDRTALGGNSRLVEGNWNDLMTTDIADVAEFNNPVVAWLPLDIQRLVVSVGQLVSAIVDAQRYGLSTIFDTRDIGQIFAEVRRLGAG